MDLKIKILHELERLDNPLVRDFTESAEEDMVQIANDALEADNDLFSKYVLDPFGRWLDRMGYLDLLLGVDNYQANVIDFYNYSAEQIRTICGQVRSYDKKYGQSMAHYAAISDSVVRLTAALAECLNINSTEYDPSLTIPERIGRYSSKWVENAEGEACQVSDIDTAARGRRNQIHISEPTEEDVRFHCGQPESATMFEEYTDYIYDEALDWGAIDLVLLTGGTVIYKGVEMTLDEAIGLISQEGYSEKLVRQQLDSIIASVISAEKTATTFMKDYATAKEAVESWIKAYLDDDNVDSAFKKFVENMGGITAVKELAKKSPQILDYLFTDYKKGVEILDNIDEACHFCGCEEMRYAVTTLRQDYDNKWIGMLRKTEDFNEDMITELTKKGLKDWIKEECEDASVLLSVLDSTGIEGKVDGYHKLLALRKVERELQTAYKASIEKIQSGEYEEADVTAVNNMFQMLRETTKSIYTTYRDMCQDDPGKQIWCNEQIEKLESMRVGGSNHTCYYEAY